MKAPDSLPVDMTTINKGPTTLQRYIFALGATAVAFIIRYALDSSFGAKHFFLTFIVALIFVTWYGGFGPSLVTFGLGFLLADYFFVEPRHSMNINYWDTVTPALLVQLCIIFFGRSMHIARERADANAEKAIEHQKHLEVEVVERKRAEDEVRVLNTELEKRVELRTLELVATNQELESFTYSVSHDLRAPLRHIDGFAQVLEEEFSPNLNEEAQNLVNKIRRGSQNMGRLVDDLLNLSRVGKKDLARQRTELTPLVEHLVEDIKHDAANRNIEWQLDELPAVECDPGLIKQVFINLIENSVKYTGTREKARIEVGQKQQNGETAIFIRDNGVGFNMKYAGKLFGVFQRLHRAEEFEGTGVGLATVARIVRKHGGNIWAEAEVNKGATFYFTLGHEVPKAEAATNGHVA